MNIKQKILFPVLFLVLSFSTAIFYDVSTTYAWCNDNANLGERCGPELFDTIKDKRGIDYTKYKEMVGTCMGGNPSGADFGSLDEGTCINAVATCVQKSIKLDKCTADNMATIALRCNGGKMWADNDTRGCPRMKEMQEGAFKELEDANRKKAEEACSVSGTETQKYEQQQACEKAVMDKCSAPDKGYTVNKYYKDYKFEAYDKCLSDAQISTAKDKGECEGRGGVWNGTNGPIVGSRCTAAKPTDPKTCDDGSTPGADGKCADGSTPGKKTPVQPSGSYKGTQTQNCGKAQTNILSCDKDSSGSEVIGYILKAILMIMSVGVGILAVGGIVYGAILYSSAQDNAAQTKKAIEVIINTVIGLLLYIFMYSILNWLVPGGVFL